MIRIGGLQKTTLLDYPDKIAAAVFLVGCNFRCPYCHNPELVMPNPKMELIKENDFFKFLKSRKNILEGVCVSGGEPLLQKDLPEFLHKIKSLGYLIKLDTNGYFPDKLRKMIKQNLIDYIAMDIKASEDKYEEASGIKVNIGLIKKSIKLIMNSKIPYEFRTTGLPRLHSLAEMKKIAKMIKGAELYSLQRFNPGKTLDKSWQKEKSYTDKELADLRKVLLKYVKICQIRG